MIDRTLDARRLRLKMPLPYGVFGASAELQGGPETRAPVQMPRAAWVSRMTVYVRGMGYVRVGGYTAPEAL